MTTGGAAPDFLAIGHATRDLLPGGGWRLGGTVTFAAQTASRLGRCAAVVTSGPPNLLDALRDALPGIAVAAVSSPTATTYENIYTGAARRQFLRDIAAPLTLAHVPDAWRSARIVLLAPLAHEVDSALATAFPGSLVAATPQGWLRRWDTSGLVTPGPFACADEVLPSLRALILSQEDILPLSGDIQSSSSISAGADEELARWASVVPLVVVTRGAQGALLYQHGAGPEVFPAYPARELDPTGAGDVFAAAFLCQLDTTGDARAAVDFANRVAAVSVEHPGATGIPTHADVTHRFGNV